MMMCSTGQIVKCLDCRAREDALRMERTLKRDTKLLKEELQELQTKHTTLQDEIALLQNRILELEAQKQ